MEAGIPELQPMVDVIEEFLEARGWSRHQIAVHCYGHDNQGRGRKTDKVYPITAGSQYPSKEMADLWFHRTGLDIRPWAVERAQRAPLPPSPSAAVAAFNAAAQAATEGARRPYVRSAGALTVSPQQVLPPSPAPRIALSLDGGRGSLTFNLRDAPASEVLRAFAVLQAAGLTEQPPDDS